MKRERFFRGLFAVLAIMGIMLSLYLLKAHYAPTGTSFCDLSATISCDIVNQSAYAEIFGIPVSLLGIIFYLGILAFSLAPEPLARIIADGDEGLLWIFFTGYMLFGLVFSGYLTYVEAFVLETWCPLCVASALFVIIIFGCSASVARVNY